MWTTHLGGSGSAESPLWDSTQSLASLQDGTTIPHRLPATASLAVSGTKSTPHDDDDILLLDLQNKLKLVLSDTSASCATPSTTSFVSSQLGVSDATPLSSNQPSFFVAQGNSNNLPSAPTSFAFPAGFSAMPSMQYNGSFASVQPPPPPPAYSGVVAQSMSPPDYGRVALAGTPPQHRQHMSPSAVQSMMLVNAGLQAATTAPQFSPSAPMMVPVMLQNGQVVMFAAPGLSPQTLAYPQHLQPASQQHGFTSKKSHSKGSNRNSGSSVATPHQFTHQYQGSSLITPEANAIGGAGFNSAPQFPSSPLCCGQLSAARDGIADGSSPPSISLVSLHPDDGMTSTSLSASVSATPATLITPSSASPSASTATSGVARDSGNRPNHGINVHDALVGSCSFHAYRHGKHQRPPEATDLHPCEQTLPIFVQMFPSEWIGQADCVFQDVLDCLCGIDGSQGGGHVERTEQRSETSFIAFVCTSKVWELIARLRCRVLMDRHGFWYADDWNSFLKMKEYCEGVRRLPQQQRHYKTDGLPCMPLVVELSRMVSHDSVLGSPATVASFDVIFAASSEVAGSQSIGLASTAQTAVAAAAPRNHHRHRHSQHQPAIQSSHTQFYVNSAPVVPPSQMSPSHSSFSVVAGQQNASFYAHYHASAPHSKNPEGILHF